MVEPTEKQPTQQAIDGFLGGAHTSALCALISLLIEKGALNQGDVMARYEALSQQLMNQIGAQYTVPVIDIIRNHVAGEQKRVPS